MFTNTCIVCKKQFEAITNIAKCCSGKCRQTKYRQTIKGKQKYTEYNKRYKREEITKICEHCNQPFNTTYKNKVICDRLTCDQYRMYLSVRKYRLNNLEKIRIQDRTNKMINREKTLTRQPCSVCDKPNAEAHYYNYEHPLNITWLCKEHHENIHHNVVV